MNILIVGGAGFLGTNLARYCLADPTNRIVVLDSLEPRLRSDVRGIRSLGSSVRIVIGDVRDRAVLEAVLPAQDVVINCAGQTSHVLSLEDAEYDLQLNCVANLRLLEAARSLNPHATYCYVSTSTVVGRASGTIDERHVERPLDILSTHKLAAEHYYQIYGAVHGLRTVVVRLANLYGPHGKADPEFGFINHFIARAWSGSELTIYGDGAQLRNVMYVEDAAAALYAAALDERAHGQVLFAAHDEHHSVRRIAEEIVAQLRRGKVIEVPWPDVRRRIDVEDVRISSGRLRSLTGWAPSYSLAEGLRRTREVLASAY